MYITAHNLLSSETTEHVWVGGSKGIDLHRSGRTSQKEADKIGRVSACFAENVVETIVFCCPCHLTPSPTPYTLPHTSRSPRDEAMEVYFNFQAFALIMCHLFEQHVSFSLSFVFVL